jgi:hypothetical protein
MTGLDGVPVFLALKGSLTIPRDRNEPAPRWYMRVVAAADAERAIREAVEAVAAHMRRTCSALEEAVKLLADRDEAYRSGVRDCADRIDTYRDSLDDATRAIVGDHLTTAADELRRALLDGPR